LDGRTQLALRLLLLLAQQLLVDISTPQLLSALLFGKDSLGSMYISLFFCCTLLHMKYWSTSSSAHETRWKSAKKKIGNHKITMLQELWHTHAACTSHHNYAS